MNTKELLNEFESDYFIQWCGQRRPYSNYLEFCCLKLRKTKLKWLDAGCGYGHLVEDARITFKPTNIECQIEAFGFEISKYALSKSNAKGWLCRCDAHNIPFKTDTFDVVSAFDIVEHVSDPY